jgi:hypothetical protein
MLTKAARKTIEMRDRFFAGTGGIEVLMLDYRGNYSWP